LELPPVDAENIMHPGAHGCHVREAAQVTRLLKDFASARFHEKLPTAAEAGLQSAAFMARLKSRLFT
jgi:hypothetical protein